MKKIVYILALSLLFAACSKAVFKEKWTSKKAPEVFRAKFETTQGDFVIVANRSWSPQGVDRLYQLIESGFYTDIAVFRVVPNFVAQFGIHTDSVLNKSWRKYKIDDEPVLAKNDVGAISFARGGKKTRTTQIFINLKDNHRLDDLEYSGVKGFPVIAKVIKGMENVQKFYGEYGDRLGMKQDSIQTYGNKFLRKNYPKVDYIHKAYIIK